MTKLNLITQYRAIRHAYGRGMLSVRPGFHLHVHTRVHACMHVHACVCNAHECVCASMHAYN